MAETATLSEAARVETVIDGRSARFADSLLELWRSRELLGFFVWRDLVVRYKQTALGVAWVVIQPTLMMIVFWLMFSRLTGAADTTVPYPLFLFAGILPWTFFSAAVASSATSVVASERLITKVYFPRLAIPFSSVGASLVDFLIASGVLALLMIYYLWSPSISVVLLPLMIVLLTGAALGIGTLIAALNVAYRDFRYVIGFVLQLWMFATPSIYLSDWHAVGTGGVLRTLLGNLLIYVNPMTGLVASFRSVILGMPIPWMTLVISSAVSAGLFLVGCIYFRRMERSFADII